MEPVRVAINGFGRIGRLVFRAILREYPHQFKVVAINDLASPEMNVHLLKHDSNYGLFPGVVELDRKMLVVNHEPIHLYRTKEISELPWKKHSIDIVIEATGCHTDATEAREHLAVGAKRAIITAPAKMPDATLVLGVNHDLYNPKKHFVVSNASCTTNSLAPIAKVLNEEFTIERGFMATIHAYTGEQKLLDAFHPKGDLRRARAAAQNIIPTTTGAAKAIGLVIPELNGKIHGIAIRVPTPTGSITDLVVLVKKNTTREKVLNAFEKWQKKWESEELKILRVEKEALVSCDYVGEEYSTVIDGENVVVAGRNLIQLLAWYDNEWAYSQRIADLAAFMVKRGI